MGAHDLVDRYAQRIVDTPAARSAVQTIVAAADNPAVAGQIAAGQSSTPLTRRCLPKPVWEPAGSPPRPAPIRRGSRRWSRPVNG